MSRFESPWKDALRTIIETYAQANHHEPSLKGSIFLGQAALESLAWVVLVEQGRILRPDGLKALRAADQIGLLLHELQIPRNIPPHFTALEKFGSHAKLNGPEALTEVRNKIIHAEPGMKRSVTAAVLDEAWLLAMHYVELSLLRICDYKDIYYNRCKGPLMNECSVERVSLIGHSPPSAM
ncbi:MAG TPA: hypothetical protein VH325_13505 [Bryobacteraceae bacterium]|jgi:hypothetical protein|nr:hypothetical protein [Bryobacteraceae bacterium]